MEAINYNRINDYKRVENGIPNKEFIGVFHLLSEALDNPEGNPPDETLKAVAEYSSRVLGRGIIPQDKILLSPFYPGKEYLDYLEEQSNSSIKVFSFDWLLNLPEDIDRNSIKKEIRNIFKRENINGSYVFNFISSRISLELAEVLKEIGGEGLEVDNIGNEINVESSNDKGLLRRNFSEYMANGIYLYLYENNWVEDLIYKFNEYKNKGYDMLVRLGRSASSLGTSVVTRDEDLYELIDNIKENKDDYNSDYLCIDILIPKKFIESSPSCLAYINEDGNVEIFGYTNQLLDDNDAHEGNTIITNKTPVTDKMGEVTKTISYSNYLNNKLEGYVGFDFLIVNIVNMSEKEISDIGITDDMKIIDEDGEEKAILLVEENARVTGAYPSVMIYNLYKDYLSSECVVENLNTIEYSFKPQINKGKLEINEDYYESELQEAQNKIISNLSKEGILFSPKDGKFSGIYPYAILPGKLQVVIVGKDINDFNFKKEKLYDVISGVEVS